jgi:hypothetical protein
MSHESNVHYLPNMSVHAGTIIHVGATTSSTASSRPASATCASRRRHPRGRQRADRRQGPGRPGLHLHARVVRRLHRARGVADRQGRRHRIRRRPGAADPDGTAYNWADCGFVNVPSPWKDPPTGSAGVVEAGPPRPGYYPTRIRYRFGVTDNATQTVELSGGSFYYADGAPVEQFETGDGATTTFPTDRPGDRRTASAARRARASSASSA